MHSIHVSSHRAPGLDPGVYVSLAAQRDPGDHAAVDTATCITHMHYILSTWSPTQISVDRHRYWHRGHTHAQALQRLPHPLTIRYTHGRGCMRDRHYLHKEIHIHRCSDTCGQKPVYNHTQFQTSLSTQTNGTPNA